MLRLLVTVQAQARLKSVRVFVYSPICQTVEELENQPTLNFVRRVRIPSLAPIIFLQPSATGKFLPAGQKRRFACEVHRDCRPRLIFPHE
jgi:hypothetical protein